jgi:hypothetical protein
MKMKKIIMFIFMIVFGVSCVNSINITGLESHWSKDNLLDISGNDRTLTNSGASSTSSNCHLNTCYDYTSSESDYMSYSTSLGSFPVADDSRTLSAWVYHESLGANGMYHQYGTAGAKTTYAFYKKNDNKVCVVDDLTLWCSSSTLSINTLYHVVSVYDSSASTMSIYINGVLDGGTQAVAYDFLTSSGIVGNITLTFAFVSS